MKISKTDALNWFEYLCSLSDDRAIMCSKYEEVIVDTFSQIEKMVIHRNNDMMSKIKNLRTLGKRTYFVGNEKKFSKGCRSCIEGSGLTTIRKTNKCNASCKFCYNYGMLEYQRPIPEGMWEIGGTKFYEEDIDLLLSIYDKPTGICYVYLEPFMEIEKYYSIIRKFSEAEIHQHLYTNGILATEKTIKALGEAGLDEIRFNLGASQCSDKVIENIKIAKKYIKSVGIETPMTPEFYDLFLQKKNKILETGLDFINCAELHLNQANIENYTGENMYMSRCGYISPIWSREITFKLMKLAADECWDCVIHDCSNSTKFSRELNINSKMNMWFGASSYGREIEEVPLEYFLPILRDEELEFLEEEELPEEYKLENIT